MFHSMSAFWKLPADLIRSLPNDLGSGSLDRIKAVEIQHDRCLELQQSANGKNSDAGNVLGLDAFLDEDIELGRYLHF
jgi:hypothetical protein